jgi:hypothetical protein
VTERELLELAAKAAGLWDTENDCIDIPWNPLANDGDALRLAVKLRIETRYDTRELCVSATQCQTDSWDYVEQFDGDDMAATRRAIVRAAAEIGKAVK